MTLLALAVVLPGVLVLAAMATTPLLTALADTHPAPQQPPAVTGRAQRAQGSGSGDGVTLVP